jgi:hypothetical protein
MLISQYYLPTHKHSMSFHLFRSLMSFWQHFNWSSMHFKLGNEWLAGHSFHMCNQKIDFIFISVFSTVFTKNSVGRTIYYVGDTLLY